VSENNAQEPAQKTLRVPTGSVGERSALQRNFPRARSGSPAAWPRAAGRAAAPAGPRKLPETLLRRSLVPLWLYVYQNPSQRCKPRKKQALLA